MDLPVEGRVQAAASVEPPKPDVGRPKSAGSTEPAPPPHSSIVTMVAGLASHFRLVGIYLVLLISAATILAIMLFSAANIQASVAEISFGGAPLNIWRLQELRPQWQASKDRIAAIKQQLDQLQVQLAAARSQVASDQAKQSSSEALFDSRLKRFIAMVRTIDKTAIDEGSEKDAASLETMFGILDIKLAAPPFSDNKRIQAEFATVKEQHLALDGLRATTLADQENFKEQQATVDGVTAAYAAATDLVAGLFGVDAASLTPEFRARVLNLLTEFSQIVTVSGHWIYGFALNLSEMLTLELVIVMGVLGSSLQLLSVFLTDRTALPIEGFLLRPFLGAVTALVVYIVAKSGIPILTDSSKLGGSAAVNPYFVSFLAIISGLMAERALDAIRGLAGSLLARTGNETSHAHARTQAIQDAFAESQQTPEGFAELLGIPVAKVRDWIDAKTTVDAPTQLAFSAFLRKPKDALFEIHPDP